MKQIALVFLAAIMFSFFSGCSKDDPWGGKEYDPRIIGVWGSSVERPYSYQRFIFREDMSHEEIHGDNDSERIEYGDFTMNKTHVFVKYRDTEHNGSRISIYSFTKENNLVYSGQELQRIKEE